MKVAIDSDATGAALKAELVAFLRECGIGISDIGNPIAVEYPDVAARLATYISMGAYDRGILICGTGNGVCMMANKVPGVYAGIAHDLEPARRLAASNNAQILCLGSDYITAEKAKRVAWVFLTAEHQKRPNAGRMRQLEAAR